MEVTLEFGQEFPGMDTSSSRLVLIQNNGLVRIAAGLVQPHVVVALRLLTRLMKYLQYGFICILNISRKKLFIQMLIDRRRVIL